MELEREREREGGDVTRAWAHHRVLKHALLFMGPKDAAHIMLQCSKAGRGEGRRGEAGLAKAGAGVVLAVLHA